MGVTPDALHRAYGVALATLEGLLIHKGVLEPGELPSALLSMAEVAPSEDGGAAEALEGWAAMLEEVDAAYAELQ